MSPKTAMDPEFPVRLECTNCGKLIALTDGERVQIRFHDLTVITEGGKTSITCPRCGTVNVIEGGKGAAARG